MHIAFLFNSAGFDRKVGQLYVLERVNENVWSFYLFAMLMPADDTGLGLCVISPFCVLYVYLC